MRKLLFTTFVVAMLLAACAPVPADQTAALEARVAALEAQLAALPAPAPVEEKHDEAASGDAFGVVVAQYVMDTAGFHAMDEALNETQTVDPAYVGAVARVQKVVAQAPWPEALHEPVEAFTAKLNEFAAALEADDGAKAAALAGEVHDAQHDLSHAIDAWVSGEEGDHGHDE